MNSADLIRMANQITDFFEVYPKPEALDGIAKHIHNMWEPRMRNELKAIIEAGGEGLKPLCVEAMCDYFNASMNDQVLVEPELVTGAGFDGQSDPRVPTHIADLAVLGQVPGHDFVTVEANPHDRDLRTPVGFDGDQVRQPRTVEHSAGGVGNLHQA